MKKEKKSAASVAPIPAAAPAPDLRHLPRTDRVNPVTGKEHPVDLEDFNGGKGHVNKAGEEFGLRHEPDHPEGKTHQLKNKEHYWEGDEKAFREEFQKK